MNTDKKLTTLTLLSLWPLLGGAGAVTQTAEGAKGLNHRIFFIESVMSNGTSMGEEYLAFYEGKLRGSECTTYGFNDPVYKVVRSPDASPSSEVFTFSATMQSPKEGTLTWSGTVEDGKISGRSVWTKAGQKPIHITFRGTEVEGSAIGQAKVKLWPN